MRWLCLHAELAREFESLLGYERLQNALERQAARRLDARRAYDREYSRTHRATRRAYHRQYSRMRRKMGYRPSLETRLRAQMKRRAKRTRLRLSQRAPITCANARCGSVFVPYYSTTHYCTRACRKRANQARAHRVQRARTAAERRVSCPTCGVVFVKHKTDRMYCSGRCKDLVQYFRKWGRWPRTFAPKREGHEQRAA